MSSSTRVLPPQIPTGGAAGYVLTKNTDAAYDYSWQPGGGGGGGSPVGPTFALQFNAGGGLFGGNGNFIFDGDSVRYVNGNTLVDFSTTAFKVSSPSYTDGLIYSDGATGRTFLGDGNIDINGTYVQADDANQLVTIRANAGVQFIANILDSATALSIDPSARLLVDPSGATALDYNGRYGLDSSGQVSIDWENRKGEDSSGNKSIVWESRHLVAPDGSTVIADWSGANLNLNADPVNALDAATKNYVDTLFTSGTWHPSVQAATTSNIVLSGAPVTIDGHVVFSGDLVLVRAQAASKDDGIYKVAVGLWSRSLDMPAGSDAGGAIVPVLNGTTYGNTIQRQFTDPCVVGTNPQSWNIISTGLYSASGTGLILTGNLFSIQLDGSTLFQSVSGLKVAPLGITNTELSTGIAVNKLTAQTASKAAAYDGSGFLTSATTTVTELNYVSGVTSAIQTQINGKVAKAGDSVAGNIVYTPSSAGTISGSYSTPVNLTDAQSVYITTGGNITFNAPTGTPANGQILELVITQGSSTGTATFNTTYFAQSSTLPFPALSATTGLIDYLLFKYNSALGKYVFMASNIGVS